MVYLGFAIIGIVTSTCLHALVRNYLLASAVSALVASAIFQFAAYVQLGHLDPFFMIGFAVGALLYFGLALLVGLPFRARRYSSAPVSRP
jgi:hypothetical protein